MRLIRACAAACLLVSVSAAAHAQVGAGQVTGFVRDQAGAAVPGATITATNGETSTSRTVVTTGPGVYTVAGLPPGRYRIDARLQGFRPLRRPAAGQVSDR